MELTKSEIAERTPNVPASERLLLQDWQSQMSEMSFSGLLDMANEWGTAWPEQAAVDAVAAALIKRGAKLRRRGKNGSWYGRLADGSTDVRVSSHLGHECHDFEITIDQPMSRLRLWQFVARELRDF